MCNKTDGLNARLGALREKHAALDARIREEQKSNAACSCKISALKREKLAFKDEIARIERRLVPPTAITTATEDERTDCSGSGSLGRELQLVESRLGYRLDGRQADDQITMVA